MGSIPVFRALQHAMPALRRCLVRDVIDLFVSAKS